MRWPVASAAFALPAGAAREDVALEDLMPKGMGDRQRRPEPAFDTVVEVLRHAR